MIQSQDIRIGDVVRISEGEQIPCDLCLLATSEADGTCLVQTMNLDGETNLKTRRALLQTNSLGTRAIEEFRGVVECCVPDASVYRFDARLWVETAPNGDASQLDTTSAISVDCDQLLQQTIT